MPGRIGALTAKEIFFPFGISVLVEVFERPYAVEIGFGPDAYQLDS